jgi:hypothetical protein
VQYSDGLFAFKLQEVIDMQREGARDGYNIARGSGDGIERAVTKLSEQIRGVMADFDVQFVGGLTIKEDGKSSYHAVRELILTAKPAPKLEEPAAEEEDQGSEEDQGGQE